jgi:hypothetical protein
MGKGCAPTRSMHRKHALRVCSTLLKRANITTVVKDRKESDANLTAWNSRISKVFNLVFTTACLNHGSEYRGRARCGSFARRDSVAGLSGNWWFYAD